MRSLIRQLKEFDSSITVGKLIESITNEIEISEEKEFKDFVARFENRFYKRFEEKSDYGTRLVLVSFKELENAEPVFSLYRFYSSWLCFKEGTSFVIKDQCMPYRKEDLEAMEEITEEEYNRYLEKHDVINKYTEEILIEARNKK